MRGDADIFDTVVNCQFHCECINRSKGSLQKSLRMYKVTTLYKTLRTIPMLRCTTVHRTYSSIISAYINVPVYYYSIRYVYQSTMTLCILHSSVHVIYVSRMHTVEDLVGYQCSTCIRTLSFIVQYSV